MPWIFLSYLALQACTSFCNVSDKSGASKCRCSYGPGGQKHLGKSKGGLTKGGLSPKFSEKIGGKSSLRNRAFSRQIGTFSGPIGAFSGPIGTNSSAPHSHGGRAEIAPKRPFLAQLAPFGPSPPLLSPPLDFPETYKNDFYLVSVRRLNFPDFPMRRLGAGTRTA